MYFRCSDVLLSLVIGELILLLLFLFFFFYFIFILFFLFWLHWVFVAARGLSLVARSGGVGLLFIAVRGLLIAVASLVAEHRL